MLNHRPMDDPRLPFSTREVAVPGGTVEVYIIPDDQREAVFKQLYPFRPIPSLNRTLEDIHAEKKFKIKDFMVVREGGMNMLVSPYYFESGGTVIDWC
jgi:hypothetical protein